MDRDEAQSLFQHADQLYRTGRYAEALQRLQAIDAAYPNSARVLFPMALSLERLERPHDALAICNRLVSEFNHQKGAELKQRIEAAMAPAFAGINIGGLDDILDYKPRTAPPPLPQDEGSNRTYWIVGGAIVALLLVIGLPLLLADGDTSRETANAPTAPSAVEEPAPTTMEGQLKETIGSLSVIGVIINTLVYWFLFFWLTFIALRLIGKLPFDNFGENALDIAIVTFAFSVLFYILPIAGLFVAALPGVFAGSALGFVAYLVLASRKYELSCGELFLFFAIEAGIVLAIGLAAVVAAVVIFSALAGAAPALVTPK